MKIPDIKEDPYTPLTVGALRERLAHLPANMEVRLCPWYSDETAAVVDADVAAIVDCGREDYRIISKSDAETEPHDKVFILSSDAL